MTTDLKADMIFYDALGAELRALVQEYGLRKVRSSMERMGSDNADEIRKVLEKDRAYVQKNLPRETAGLADRLKAALKSVILK